MDPSRAYGLTAPLNAIARTYTAAGNVFSSLREKIARIAEGGDLKGVSVSALNDEAQSFDVKWTGHTFRFTYSIGSEPRDAVLTARQLPLDESGEPQTLATLSYQATTGRCHRPRDEGWGDDVDLTQPAGAEYVLIRLFARVSGINEDPGG